MSCGMVSLWSIEAIMLPVRLPIGLRPLGGFMLALAMFFTAWRSALRIRGTTAGAQPMAVQAEEREQSPLVFIVSLVFAAVVMFLCFGVGLSGEEGVLSWCAALVGYGVQAVAAEFHLTRLGFFETLVQYILVVTMLYSLGTWLVRRSTRRHARTKRTAVAGSR